MLLLESEYHMIMKILLTKTKYIKKLKYILNL
jgi:hypothetical protein